MIAIRTSIALISLAVLVAGRPLPYAYRKSLVRRQGTLVNSTDATDFGKCTTPEIKGAVGLDDRTEFAFEPEDLTSYPHTSAQNIAIITQFICDTLVNTCGASTAAHNLCTATEAAVGAGKNDGALADKFNLAFGLKTNFADAVGSIPAGSTVAVAASSTSSTTSSVAATTSSVASTTTAAEVSTVTVTVAGDCQATSVASSTTSASSTTATQAASSTTTLDLGSCSDPTILFENGLDGRTQPAFIAQNQVDFNHGSALNIAVITGFIQQRFSSPCGASQAALTAAAAGVTAAQAAGGSTGAAADAWNKEFGIITNFSAGATNA